MPWILKKRIRTDAAHILKDYPGKCSRPHGHSFVFEMEIEVQELNEIGIGMDFENMRDIMKELFPDHKMYIHKNDPYSEKFTPDSAIKLPFNPTAENLSKWLFYKIKEKGLKVKKVTVWETPFSCASYFE